MRSLVASGSQRCGEEVGATISTTLEAVPRPFAWQGCPADGDDASEGPVLDCQKEETVTPPLTEFGVRRAAPVWVPCSCFQLKMGVQTWNLFCFLSVPQGNRRVAVVPFPAGPSTTWLPRLATEPGRDERQVLV